ncbi:MAG: 3-deoxy-7-phosphoheptulonate synthase [Nitrososphaeria archaeon]
MNLKLVREKRIKDLKIGDAKIGKDFLIVAGPCAVESREQLSSTAKFLKANGTHMLRAMIFKPRSSPYSFQGLGIGGLKIVEEVKRESGMPVVIEVLDPRDIEKVCTVADAIQLGARNMQNYALLKEVGRTTKPVILKRGLSATIEEWLSAAEYMMNEGNMDVILCERGIRTFVTETRFTLDLSAVPVIKKISSLPIIVDPSHAAGASEFVTPLAKAAKAIGADGLIIEVHPDPQHALSDNRQQLDFDMFRQLMTELNELKR